jgi:hypothetical protein
MGCCGIHLTGMRVGDKRCAWHALTPPPPPPPPSASALAPPPPSASSSRTCGEVLLEYSLVAKRRASSTLPAYFTGTSDSLHRALPEPYQSLTRALLEPYQSLNRAVEL